MDSKRDTTTIREAREGKFAKHNLFETPRCFVDVYVLRPGQAQSLHRHAAEDKCYFVLSGEGRVTSGATVHDVRPGEIVFCPAGEEHGAENQAGPDDLRLLVFMAPHPRPAGV